MALELRPWLCTVALVSLFAAPACSSSTASDGGSSASGSGSASGSSSGTSSSSSGTSVSSSSGSSGTSSSSGMSGNSSTVGGSSSSSGSSSSGDEDAGLVCPQPPGSCTPCPGQTGNASNVGEYCTKGGNQCPFLVTACAADEPGGAGQNYCVVIVCPTFPDGGYNCGANACCYGEAGNPIHACVPSLCVSDGGFCPPPP